MDIAKLLLHLMMSMTSSMTMGVGSIREQTEEYCLTETFHPQCSKNEVILMESANYGRMKIGRCVKAKEIETLGDDPRYFGCAVDVLSLLDEECSGKTKCEIRVFDISDEKRQPCFDGLKMYLEASYKCINMADETRSCAVKVSRTPTHIDISRNICGTESQPWILEAPVGQKLVVSLVDLTPRESQNGNGNRCQRMGYIVDRAAARNISICGVGSREKQLYASTGNAVEITLDRHSESNKNQRNFPIFLSFEAVGCSDIVPSEDNWLKRRDDVIVIGCYSSRQTWQLNCIAGKWNGAIGNCSKDNSKSDSMHDSHLISETQLSHKAQVLAIVSLCGFTLAICFIIICIGALCLRRYYIQNKAKSDYRTLNYESDFGRAKEMTGQKTSSAFPTQRTGDPVNGSMAHHLPTYPLYLGQDGVSNADNHHGQINA